MRKCTLQENFSPLRTWGQRALRTSSRSRPQAVKQLSNAELLSLAREGDNATTTSAPNLEQSQDGESDWESPPQSSFGMDPHPPLPRSPLTESRLVAARTRHREPKPPPSKERSTFQSKLQKNPYAQALSTPTRFCLLTGVKLPSYFLIPFGIATHPETGDPWHLPRIPPSPSSSSPSHDSESTSAQLTRTATGTHFVASHESLSRVSHLSKAAYSKLLPFRWKEDPSLRVSDVVWREDMAVFVLERLRENVTTDLLYLASRPAGYIVACQSHDDISAHSQIAAVLWLGPSSGPSDQEPLEDPAVDAEKRGPPPYAMRPYQGRYVPCYNLPQLLGLANVSKLRQSSPFQSNELAEVAVIKAKRLTVKLQLELWKLLGFLAKTTVGDYVQERS